MEKHLLAAIIRSRILQLYYHYCHNLVTGPTFFSDHDFFASAYSKLTTDYDSFAEYFVEQFGKDKFKTALINEMVNKVLDKTPVENLSAEGMFAVAIAFEQEFQSELVKLDAKAGLGIKNLIGAVCEQSDLRLYKMKQRLK